MAIEAYIRQQVLIFFLDTNHIIHVQYNRLKLYISQNAYTKLKYL